MLKTPHLQLIPLTLGQRGKMETQPEQTHQNLHKTNRLAIVGFISGILSMYPIFIDSYFIATSGLLTWAKQFILGNWFDSNPTLSTYFFYGSFPFVVISFIMGISALIQIRHRGKNEKGKLLAILALVFGAIGFLFLLYMAYFTACFLPFKLPWICMYY
jgi:hypothetical protein